MAAKGEGDLVITLVICMITADDSNATLRVNVTTSLLVIVESQSYVGNRLSITLTRPQSFFIIQRLPRNA